MRVSIIIAVHNEEAVIERRIKNIYETTYPLEKLEIIVVDSGSTDNTLSILGQFSKKIRIIHEDERRGKAHAINLGLKICSGEIVILTDGPTLYKPETIIEIIKPFYDSRVGGVSVKYDIPNFNASDTAHSEYLLWSYKDRIRILESKLMTTSFLSGEACAFRRKIIEKVSEDTLADDSNIAFQIIRNGFRVVINENSSFTENSPSTSADYFKVKTRRALGGLQEIWRFRKFLFNIQYGFFGLIIFPYRFFMELVSPSLFFIDLALLIALISELITLAYFQYALGIMILLALPLFFSRTRVFTFLKSQIVLFRALMLLVGRKTDVKWVQSKTTRIKNVQ